MTDLEPRVIKTLIDAFKEYVDEVLDDPAWIQGDAPTVIADLRATAMWLGLDFDLLLKEVGSEYEVTRLLDLESNT